MVSRILSTERDTSTVRAFVCWAGDVPSPQELIALCAVVDSFRALGLAGVKQTVRGLRRWELGEFPKPYAVHELSELVQRHGLSLQLINVTR